jgi:hypothetical protein
VSVADRGRPLASCWEWHGDGTRPTRRLDLVSITNMDEAASSEEGLVALRAALLAYYDEHTSALGRQPLLTRQGSRCGAGRDVADGKAAAAS